METQGILDREAANVGHERLPIVALGAQQGGLHALQQFLAEMPVGCGMAFVVIVRQPHDGARDLVASLQEWTSLSLTQVTERTPVELDHVYVVPPDRQVVMVDGTIELAEPSRPDHQAAPIDLLFRTLAEAHGPDTAAVVLSGNGADGTMGLQRIKELGGLTLAQDPTDAEASEMPRHAVATGMVDVILPAANLPATLIKYWQRAEIIQLPAAEAPEALDENELRELFTLVRLRTGHDFSQYKRSTIVRRLARRMQVTNADTIEAYIALLRGSLDETRALLRDFLISVTNFFRDREAWEALAVIIPRLFTGKTADDQVRVWVTGCATGEEAYSVAILLHEYAASLDDPPLIQVFATDIDDDAIAVARQGRYAETIAVDVEPERLRRFFLAEPGHYRVKQEIRDAVLFASHNILRDPPFSRLDMVTCRNVLIYLDRAAQERVLRLFHFGIVPDGVLLLGSSESTDGVPDLFASVDRSLRLFQRRAALNASPLVLGDLSASRSRRPPSVAADHGDDGQRPSFSALHERLLLDHLPPSILVTGDFDVVHVAAGAGQFLQYAEGEPSHNLLDVAIPELRMELRTAFFAANQNGGVTVTRRLPIHQPGRELIELVVRPVREPAWAEGFFLIVFHQIAEIEESVRPSGDHLEPMVRQIEDELQRTREQLRITVEQYETAVEEYRAANEELQAINEEARATSEELETSKEELQAANEELSTLNQALKHSLDEANRSANDLQNLIAANDIATIFLDDQLRISRFTPTAQALFNVLPADINRPLDHITHRLRYDELRSDAERVQASSKAFEREVSSLDGRWYLARLLPYWTADATVTGFVLTFVDITVNKEAEAERERLFVVEQDARGEAEEAVRVRDQFLSIASHELRTPLTTVQGYAAMLERRPQDAADNPARTQRIVNTIVRQTARLSTLIEQLLDVSRLQRGQFELVLVPLDFGLLLTGAIADYQLALPPEEPGTPVHTVVLSPGDVRLPMLGDAIRLEQVLQNLLNNAVKYSPEGGDILVRVRGDASEAIIEIEDKGAGISAEARPRLFEPFFRAGTDDRGDAGFGIGLYVVDEIVKRHGGRIEVQSAEGHGSTFRVILPLLETEE